MPAAIEKCKYNIHKRTTSEVLKSAPPRHTCTEHDRRCLSSCWLFKCKQTMILYARGLPLLTLARQILTYRSLQMSAKSEEIPSEASRNYLTSVRSLSHASASNLSRNSSCLSLTLRARLRLWLEL